MTLALAVTPLVIPRLIGDRAARAPCGRAGGGARALAARRGRARAAAAAGRRRLLAAALGDRLRALGFWRAQAYLLVLRITSGSRSPSRWSWPARGRRSG